MFEITLPFEHTAGAWRAVARRLLAARVDPSRVRWQIGERTHIPNLPEERYRVRVPERLLTLSDVALWHEESDRFDLMYQLSWKLRLAPNLMADTEDKTVSRCLDMETDVLRSLKRLNRSLRLSEVHPNLGRRLFVGWCDVPHDPLELALPRLCRQLSDFDWTIYTPQRVARSVNGSVSVSSAPERPDLGRDTTSEPWVEWLRAQEYPTPSETHNAVGF